MAGGTTQAMAAPAVRRERHDTTQPMVWGFIMRCRIRDRGFSPRSGKNGPNWFLTPLSNSIPDRRGSPTPPNATTSGLPTPIRGRCTLSHPHDEAERPSDNIEERRKNHTERPPRASRSGRQMCLSRSPREFLERSGPAQQPATLSRSVRSRSPGQGPPGVKGIQRCLPASPSLR